MMKSDSLSAETLTHGDAAAADEETAGGPVAEHTPLPVSARWRTAASTAI